MLVWSQLVNSSTAPCIQIVRTRFERGFHIADNKAAKGPQCSSTSKYEQGAVEGAQKQARDHGVQRSRFRP